MLRGAQLIKKKMPQLNISFYLSQVSWLILILIIYFVFMKQNFLLVLLQKFTLKNSLKKNTIYLNKVRPKKRLHIVIF